MRSVSILLVFLAILGSCTREERQRRPVKRHRSLKLSSVGDETGDAGVDLNADGVKDVVRLECVKHGHDFRLFVNDVSIAGRGYYLNGDYTIVDLDVADQFKEISISESGPSDDYATSFYYYDGQNIIPMGKIQGSYKINIDGSGIVKTETRGRILHTWFYPDFYKLSRDHTLEHIDKDLYLMNWSLTSLDSLTLQKSREDPEPVVTLVPGENVTIVSSDNKEWCLVENSKGVRGWFAIDGFNEIRGTGKRARDLFEGFSFAD